MGSVHGGAAARDRRAARHATEKIDETRALSLARVGSELPGPPPATVGLRFGDPAALWSRLRGEDPFAAERRSFLERTGALRDYLAGRHAQDATSEPVDDLDGDAPEPQLERSAGAP